MKKIITCCITILFVIVNTEKSRAQTSTTIYTPNCSVVSDTYICPELTSAQIAANNNYVQTNYPNATRLSDASGTYNCHGYAWYMTQGGNNVWIGYYTTTAEDVFWTDGSYDEVSAQSDNSKVSYASDNHSAITTAVTDVFQSKWGQLPLMKHNKNYCPYNSSVLKYYKISYAISGPASLCSGTSTAYTILNLPVGPSVTWSATPTGVVTINSPNASQTTLTKTGNGTITLTATITNVCGGNPVVISNSNITVGLPTSIGIDVGAGGYTNMEDCDATDFKVLYNAAGHNYLGYLYVTASNANSLSWTEVSNSSIPYWGWSTSNNGHTLYVSQTFANKYLSLKVTATNACGSINKIYTFGSNVCPIIPEFTIGGDDYLLAPNPAANNVTVSVNSGAKNSEAVSFAQIRVYDGTGNLKKELKYGNGTRQAQVNIADLRPGYYYVEISDGKTVVKKPLVVQR